MTLWRALLLIVTIFRTCTALPGEPKCRLRSAPSPSPDLYSRSAAAALVATRKHEDSAATPELVLASAIIKNIVGAGLFALSSSLSISRTGLIPGLVLVVVLAAVSGLSFCLLATATARLDDDDILTTEDLWRNIIGPGANWVSTMVMVQACGALVQYTATLVELLGASTGKLSRPVRLLLIGTALLPLCLAKDLSALSFSSSLGLAGVGYSMVFMCWRAFDGSYAPGGRFAALSPTEGVDIVPALSFGWRSLSLVGVLNTAYFAHLNVPAYWTAWKALSSTGVDSSERSRVGSHSVRGRFVRVVVASFTLVALLYAAAVVIAAKTFGSSGGDGRLLIMRYAGADRGAALMRLATIASVATGYPLIFHAVRDVAFARLLPPESGDTPQRTISVALLIGIMALALCVPNLTTFIAVRGALLGSLLVYSIPALIGLATAKNGAAARQDAPAYAPDLQSSGLICLCVYGVVSSLAGTTAALR